MNEFTRKQEAVKQLLIENQVEALLLRKASSFAWATCGASSYINTASTDGLASLLITPSNRYAITTNIEATRLEKEEGLAAQGWQLIGSPWHESPDVIAELAPGLRLAADGSLPGALDLSAQVSRLRSNLLPEEAARMTSLGRLCADAMDEAIRQVKPGQSEFEIAGLLAGAAESRGVQAIVNLVATDERIYTFRHPLPTERKMERYAMLVLCGRRWGLVCSITRLVHFGPLPEELKRKQTATAVVDGTFLLATRPGRPLNEILSLAIEAYTATGYPGEWRLHHQGGPAGYEPRETVATPATTETVSVHQAFAWNPSITGTKSEDTILVGEVENTVLTEIRGWSMLSVDINGQEVKRPAILEIL
jgi:Xaa-Pro aminopeptidase